MNIALNWILEPLATAYHALSAESREIESAARFRAALKLHSVENDEHSLRKSLADYFGNYDTDLPADLKIAALNSACDSAWPGLNAELNSRTRPIREHWEARGPGMFHFLSERQLLSKEDVVLPLYLLKPLLGGGGFALKTPHSLVGFEALLANVSQLVPEVVRLLWYILQAVTDKDPQQLLAWAIHAGEAVELCRCDEVTLTEVKSLWRLNDQNLDLAHSMQMWQDGQ
jgi:hypothetical protein